VKQFGRGDLRLSLQARRPKVFASAAVTFEANVHEHGGKSGDDI
jgi:hypothetical protein